MTDKGLQRLTIIQRALAAQAPELQPQVKIEPLVTFEVADPRYAAALRDYSAAPYMNLMHQPNERATDPLQFRDEEKVQDEAFMARETADLQQYLKLHLLGQRLSEALAKHVRIRMPIKPTFMLAEDVANEQYMLDTTQAPGAAQLLETMLDAQGVRGKAALQPHRRNAQGMATMVGGVEEKPLLAVTEPALDALAKLDDAAFFACANEAWRTLEAKRTNERGR